MADLSRFGVPLSGEKLGILQPRQQFKFRVVFLGLGYQADTRIVTQNVQTVTRPGFTSDPVPVHSYNSIGYIQSKYVWNPVEITLRDDISNGVIALLGQQTQKQMNHFEQTTPVSGANYKFTTEIHSLDGRDGEELEKWVLDGCWLTSVTHPQGNYSSSDLHTITMSIRYDVATQLAGPNTNDGTTVGGNPFPNNPSGGGSVNIA